MTWILKRINITNTDETIEFGAHVSQICKGKMLRVFSHDLVNDTEILVTGKIVDIQYPTMDAPGLVRVQWGDIPHTATYHATALGLRFVEVLPPPELPTSVDLLIQNLEEALRAYRERQNA